MSESFLCVQPQFWVSPAAAFHFLPYITFQWGAIICIFAMKFAFYLQFMYFRAGKTEWLCVCVILRQLAKNIFLTFESRFSTFIPVLFHAFKISFEVQFCSECCSLVALFFCTHCGTHFFLHTHTLVQRNKKKRKVMLIKKCMQIQTQHIYIPLTALTFSGHFH